MGFSLKRKLLNKGFCLGLCALGLSSLSGNLLAEEDYDYHPVLSDNFVLSLGLFKSDEAFSLSAGDRDIGEDIDFGKSLGVDNSSVLFNGQLRWKFGKERKWSLAGQRFTTDNTGAAELKEDFSWQGITFGEGTNVGAGVKIEISRLFLGRSFVKNQQHDFGVGLGIHNLDLSAFIEGEVIINDETTGFQRGDADASQLLPNVGAWYHYSPARKWLIHGRVDWISAKIGELDGTLWNTELGFNYQAFRHVGFDLSYQYFNLNVGVDKTDWIGGVDLRYSGPVLAVVGSW